MGTECGVETALFVETRCLRLFWRARQTQPAIPASTAAIASTINKTHPEESAIQLGFGDALPPLLEKVVLLAVNPTYERIVNVAAGDQEKREMHTIPRTSRHPLRLTVNPISCTHVPALTQLLQVLIFQARWLGLVRTSANPLSSTRVDNISSIRVGQVGSCTSWGC